MARLAAHGVTYSDAWAFAPEEAEVWQDAYRAAREAQLGREHEDLADRISARLRPGGR